MLKKTVEAITTDAKMKDLIAKDDIEFMGKIELSMQMVCGDTYSFPYVREKIKKLAEML